ncbi:MAG: pentapeptide repeat-containing protein, partial [Bdellovibrio bacteriovorus]
MNTTDRAPPGRSDTRKALRRALGLGLLAVAALAGAEDLPRGDCAAPRPATDLRHCNLGEARLQGVDLRNAQLDGVRFENADLTGCKLAGASLVKANLRWTKLAACDLTGAKLNGADLFHAILDEADLTGADLTQADLFGANLIEVHGKGANFSRAFLKDLLMEGGNLPEARFDNAFMLRAVLIGSR